MGNYKIKKASKLGDYDQKYGQRFWAEVEEAQMPVSFNLMDSSVAEIPAGMPIEFEERKMKTSAKGNDYMHLTKVKLMGKPITAAPVTNDSDKFQEVVLDKLDEILAILKVDEVAAKQVEQDIVATDIGDDPINLEDIPF